MDITTPGRYAIPIDLIYAHVPLSVEGEQSRTVSFSYHLRVPYPIWVNLAGGAEPGNRACT